jgi:glutamate racemase
MIGVFDSGLGGLGVVGHIRRLCPNADIVYLGDRARAPYGDRSLDDVRRYAEEITAHLIGRGAETIVLACNTASAAALHHLRDRHPSVAFVGMEPAVKPAAALSKSGVIAVLATPATFQGELFASVVDRFAGEARVVCRACRGWVELVERGATEGPEAESLVAGHLQPVLAEGADVLVLACTHYPFLATTIGRLAGEAVTIIDPADAVARQTARLATTRGKGDLEICVTGPADGLAEVVQRLTGLDQPIRTVTLGP